MPKTNYDVIMENMTVDQLAMYIDRSEYELSCKKCVYYPKKCTPAMCHDGIKQWLLSESVSCYTDTRGEEHEKKHRSADQGGGKI